MDSPPLATEQQQAKPQSLDARITQRAEYWETCFLMVISVVVAVGWIYYLHIRLPGDWTTIVVSILFTGAEAGAFVFSSLVHLPKARWLFTFIAHVCAGASIRQSLAKSHERFLVVNEGLGAGRKAVWNCAKLLLLGTALYLGLRLLPYLREFTSRHAAAHSQAEPSQD